MEIIRSRLVSDNLTYQNLLKDYLTERGYSTIIAQAEHPSLEMVVVTLGEEFFNLDQTMTDETVFFQLIGPEIIGLARRQGGWLTIGYMHNPDCFEEVEKYLRQIKRKSKNSFRFYDEF